MDVLMVNKLAAVSIWGILPAFLALIVFLCTIIIKCMKKEILSLP